MTILSEARSMIDVMTKRRKNIGSLVAEVSTLYPYFNGREHRALQAFGDWAFLPINY